MDALDDGSLLTLKPDDPLALEILAHWDELTPSGLERLERQPVLGPRLARLRRAERWLVERTADPTCPDADELYDYGRGPGYRPLPVLYNEDDHFAFDRPHYNLLAAVEEYVSWGYFDFRMKGEGFDDGYQSPPVNWGISSPRKKAFFARLREITGER